MLGFSLFQCRSARQRTVSRWASASIVLAVILSISWSRAYALSWNLEVVDSYNVGKFASIAVDSRSNVHTVYYDNLNGNLKYAVKSGGTWTKEVVTQAGAPNGGSIAVHTSLAVDSRGAPHVVFYDDNAHSLKYAAKSRIGWLTEVVDPGPWGGVYPSIAVGPFGDLHVSYHGRSSGGFENGFLIYATRQGGSWVRVVLDGGQKDEDAGYNTSIAVDSLNQPHISYVAYPSIGVHMTSALKYAFWPSGLGPAAPWTIQVLDASGRVTDNSIALDSAGQPHIGYHDWQNDSLKYVAYLNGSWTPSATVDGTQPGGTPVIVGRFASIAVDAMGRPHLSYYDITNHDLKYARLTGGVWSTEIVDAGGSVGAHADLALDAAGIPHIVYYDLTIPYALKYAVMSSVPAVAPPVEVVIISPGEFPQVVTAETRCADSIGGTCIRIEIVRLCVGGNCFDVPPVPPPCPACERITIRTER
jgi:hypothetical protein